MAYVEKYFIEYCDDFNTDRRVSIKRRYEESLEGGVDFNSDFNDISWIKNNVQVSEGSLDIGSFFRISSGGVYSSHSLYRKSEKNPETTDYVFSILFWATEFKTKQCYVNITDDNGEFIQLDLNVEDEVVENSSVSSDFTLHSTSFADDVGFFKKFEVQFTSTVDRYVNFEIGLIDNDEKVFGDAYTYMYMKDPILELGDPAPSNLLLSPLDFSNSAWSNTGLEIQDSRIVANSNNSPHWIEQEITKDSSSIEYTANILVKAQEYSRLYFRISDGNFDSIINHFNTVNQQFTQTVVDPSFTNLGTTYTDEGDGWYKVNVHFTSSSDDELSVVFGIVDDNDDYIFAGENINGVNTDGLLLKSPKLIKGSDEPSDIDPNAPIQLLADVNPISITYESSDDFKFSAIRPSVAEVFMIFGSGDGVDFEEFWTADEKEWMIQDIKDGVVEWSGFVIPNGFQYDLKGGLYHATLNASDGLGTLEALTFVDDNQKPYGNQDLTFNNGFEFPFILIISEILKKLELDLDIWTCVDSYERTMTKTGDTRDADPLASAYVNVKTYIKSNENENIPYWYGSGEEWNCKEVLENVLHIFGAKLYQEFGVWRVKSVNADADFGSGDTQRYWRKYNTAATYLYDYEVLDEEVNIPCGVEDKLMLNNDHSVYMDEVYKAFRMNYEYTFVRDGDTPINLLKNGSFINFNNTSPLAAPDYWTRFKRYHVNIPDNKGYIRIRDVDINDDIGFYKGLEFGFQKTGIPITGTFYGTSEHAALRYGEDIVVNKGDSISYNFWNNYIYRGGVFFRASRYTPIYTLILLTNNDSNDKYFLRNGLSEDSNEGFVWEKSSSKDYDDIMNGCDAFTITADTAIDYDSNNDTVKTWYNHRGNLPQLPEGGVLSFFIHGLGGTNLDLPRGSYRGSFVTYRLSGGVYKRVRYWQEIPSTITLQPLTITGYELGLIPNESELPQQQDYVYNNINPNYTLEVDPITIYNGDSQDEKHISNIIVPTNTSSKNFWDDLGNTFGTSSLGLLTTREIMRQYAKPYRVLEGDVKIQDARFGSVYTFDIIPNIRFILHRGTLNKQKQYIEDATFMQISNDILPIGGDEGNNDLNPRWQETGVIYCQTEDGLNNGYVMVEQIDNNPNSDSYGETREIVSENQDLDFCPLNTPRLYYWNSDGVNLNLSTLKISPFTEIDSKTIQLDYDNEDGNYLYFVHLKSLGTLERIYTNTSPGNVLSDWIYLADQIIDGYIYRVIRTDYVMAEFSNFTHNFKFS